MKNKIFLSLVLIIVLLVASGVTYSFLTQQKSVSPSPSPTASAQLPSSPFVSPQPSPSAKTLQGNFSEEGSYLLIDGRPVFRYVQPGKSTTNLNLLFAGGSSCDFGQGEGKCNVHLIQSGDRVSMEGIKDGDMLTIVKMKKI